MEMDEEDYGCGDAFEMVGEDTRACLATAGLTLLCSTQSKRINSNGGIHYFAHESEGDCPIVSDYDKGGLSWA